jgi:hypothetical protein
MKGLAFRRVVDDDPHGRRGNHEGQPRVHELRAVQEDRIDGTNGLLNVPELNPCVVHRTPFVALAARLRSARGVDYLAGDEARVIADEEGDNMRDVLGFAYPAYRYLPGHDFLHLSNGKSHPAALAAVIPVTM